MTECAYMTRDVRVGEAQTAYAREVEALLERAKDWARRAADATGSIGFEPFVVRGFQLHCVGVKPVPGLEPPRGLRLQALARDGRLEAWVPDKRYKVGKDLARALSKDVGSLPDVRSRIPGMPHEVWQRAEGWSSKVHHYGIFEWDGAWYVNWAVDIEAVAAADDHALAFAKSALDLSMWTRIPLSQYYAAAEAAEAARESTTPA